MFGYFKLDSDCPREIAADYKKYYCFLCRCLSKYYGQLPRFTLSYDVAFFLIMVSDTQYLQTIQKVTCIGNGKQLRTALEHPRARQAATLNILLSAAKLEDDILDEGSFSSRLIHGLLSGPIRKAKKDAPRMWEIITEEYGALRILEQKNAPLEQLEQCFSRMMVRIATDCFGLTQADRLAYLQTAASWLYYIDAVDDLDENIREGVFNPLTRYQSFSQLKNCHYQDIAAHLQQLYHTAPRVAPQDMNGLILDRVLFYGIPDTTFRVLRKKEGMR